VVSPQPTAPPSAPPLLPENGTSIPVTGLPLDEDSSYADEACNALCEAIVSEVLTEAADEAHLSSTTIPVDDSNTNGSKTNASKMETQPAAAKDSKVRPTSSVKPSIAYRSLNARNSRCPIHTPKWNVPYRYRPTPNRASYRHFTQSAPQHLQSWRQPQPQSRFPQQVTRPYWNRCHNKCVGCPSCRPTTFGPKTPPPYTKTIVPCYSQHVTGTPVPCYSQHVTGTPALHGVFNTQLPGRNFQRPVGSLRPPPGFSAPFNMQQKWQNSLGIPQGITSRFSLNGYRSSDPVGNQQRVALDNVLFKYIRRTPSDTDKCVHRIPSWRPNGSPFSGSPTPWKSASRQNSSSDDSLDSDTLPCTFCGSSILGTMRKCPALFVRCLYCSIQGHFTDRCVFRMRDMGELF
jgi:hypothetical protein